MSLLTDFVSSGPAGIFGTSTFAGGGSERTIAHGMGVTPTSVHITPTTNPGGYLGETWVRKDATNIYVGNSGSHTGAFSWTAFE